MVFYIALLYNNYSNCIILGKERGEDNYDNIYLFVIIIKIIKKFLTVSLNHIYFFFIFLAKSKNKKKENAKREKKSLNSLV